MITLTNNNYNKINSHQLNVLEINHNEKSDPLECCFVCMSISHPILLAILRYSASFVSIKNSSLYGI